MLEDCSAVLIRSTVLALALKTKNKNERFQIFNTCAQARYSGPLTSAICSRSTSSSCIVPIISDYVASFVFLFLMNYCYFLCTRDQLIIVIHPFSPKLARPVFLIRQRFTYSIPRHVSQEIYRYFISKYLYLPKFCFRHTWNWRLKWLSMMIIISVAFLRRACRSFFWSLSVRWQTGYFKVLSLFDFFLDDFKAVIDATNHTMFFCYTIVSLLVWSDTYFITVP